MKFKLLIGLLLLSFVSLNAQDAKSILDKANNAFVKAGGIKASFILNTQEPNQKVTYSQDGSIYIKGDKFKIDVPDAITWFNGTTQWSYIKGSDEVNVTNPTGNELAGISPSVLLNIYKKGFKLINKGEAEYNGKKLYQIELIPENKNADFSKLIIGVNKTDYLIVSISLYTKDGLENKLILNKIQTNVNLSDDTFVFKKTDYPNAEIIDLR